MPLPSPWAAAGPSRGDHTENRFPAVNCRPLAYDPAVHPMERLRALARVSDAPVIPLVREASRALSAVADDRAALLTACRRLLEHWFGCAPLVWLAARMLSSSDPRAAARGAVEALQDDATGLELQAALPEGVRVVMSRCGDITGPVLAARGETAVFEADLVELPAALVAALPAALPSDGPSRPSDETNLVVFESNCIGPGKALLPAGSRAEAGAWRAEGCEVWLVGGVGRFLPAAIWDSLVSRVAEAGGRGAGMEIMALDGYVDRLVTPAGLLAPDMAGQVADCPVVSELLR